MVIFKVELGPQFRGESTLHNLKPSVFRIVAMGNEH